MKVTINNPFVQITFGDLAFGETFILPEEMNGKLRVYRKYRMHPNHDGHPVNALLISGYDYGMAVGNDKLVIAVKVKEMIVEYNRI